MKKLIIIALLSCLLIPSVCSAFDVNLQWDSYTDPNATELRLYRSTVQGQYTYGGQSSPNFVWDVPPSTTIAGDIGLADGTYYYVLTAYGTVNGQAVESGPSNEVTVTYPIPIGTLPEPTGLAIHSIWYQGVQVWP